MTEDSKERMAKSLFYDILMEEMVWSELCSIKNMMIDPMWSFDDSEDPKYKGIQEKYEKIDNEFSELLDLIIKCQEKDEDAFYELMGWEKPDRAELRKFVDKIIGTTIEIAV